MIGALAIGTVAALELYGATWLPAWAAWFVAWAGLGTGWVALAYALNRPAMLGKLSGIRSVRLLLAPPLLFSRTVARVAARLGVAAPAQEIVPGLWVGPWPGRATPPELALVDVTAELPRRATANAWRCVPMLDGEGPRPEAYALAVAQAVAWRKEGRPVLVHCAFGHGRSVAVVVGVLLEEGWDPDVDAAFGRVKAIRPRAHLVRAQRAAVDARYP